MFSDNYGMAETTGVGPSMTTNAFFGTNPASKIKSETYQRFALHSQVRSSPSRKKSLLRHGS